MYTTGISIDSIEYVKTVCTYLQRITRLGAKEGFEWLSLVLIIFHLFDWVSFVLIGFDWFSLDFIGFHRFFHYLSMVFIGFDWFSC